MAEDRDREVRSDGRSGDGGRSIGRRSFLYTAGAGAGLAVFALSACDDDDEVVGGPNQDPRPSFQFSPGAPSAGEEVAFDATSSIDLDGEIVDYAWAFGDGESGQGITVTHTYDEEGDYQVTLTVTDEEGASASVSRTVMVGVMAVTIDFASAVGVLNYAYALEQLEAAFYITAVNNPWTGRTAAEAAFLENLGDHEIAHREFFEAKILELGGDPLPGLTPNFGSVDFTDRDSVLQTARRLEDLGVAAYNGAGSLIEAVDPLVNAGEIVSVEARHAAAIRDLIDPLSFAPNAFDNAFSPAEVLSRAAPFIANEVNTNGL